MLARLASMSTALIMLTAGCLPNDPVFAPRRPYGTISGTVTVAGTSSTGIDGATVGVHPYPYDSPVAVTDRFGRYSIALYWPEASKSPPGEIALAVDVFREAFEPRKRIPVRAIRGQDVRMDVSMTPTASCTGAVDISVSPGTAPDFSWAPACRMWRVRVESEAGAAQWWFGADTSLFVPPVSYAVMPNGARELVPPTTLVPGAPYRVVVYRWTGPGADDGEAVGVRTFIP